MKKGARIGSIVVFIGVLLIFGFFIWWKASYRRPYRAEVEGSGLSPSLVYAVMKAESGFDEKATSRAGAIGLMQLMPSTAEFLCRRNHLEFAVGRLYEGEYNVRLGCLYLKYLLERFPAEETALAAYNAGEGTVQSWLKAEASADGRLRAIPYPETARYVKKVMKFRKKYLFFYRESS